MAAQRPAVSSARPAGLLLLDRQLRVSNQVKWRGEVYNLLQDGFMRNDARAAERKPEAVLTA